MGRIKSTLVKRTAKELIKKYEFSDNFEKNKKLLTNTMPSKKISNKVAGYISRLERMKKNNNLHAQQTVEA